MEPTPHDLSRCGVTKNEHRVGHREPNIGWDMLKKVCILMGPYPLRIWITLEKSPCSHDTKSQKKVVKKHEKPIVSQRV